MRAACMDGASCMHAPLTSGMGRKMPTSTRQPLKEFDILLTQAADRLNHGAGRGKSRLSAAADAPGQGVSAAPLVTSSCANRPDSSKLIRSAAAPAATQNVRVVEVPSIVRSCVTSCIREVLFKLKDALCFRRGP